MLKHRRKAKSVIWFVNTLPDVRFDKLPVVKFTLEIMVLDTVNHFVYKSDVIKATYLKTMLII